MWFIRISFISSAVNHHSIKRRSTNHCSYDCSGVCTSFIVRNRLLHINIDATSHGHPPFRVRSVTPTQTPTGWATYHVRNMCENTLNIVSPCHRLCSPLHDTTKAIVPQPLSFQSTCARLRLRVCVCFAFFFVRYAWRYDACQDKHPFWFEDFLSIAYLSARVAVCVCVWLYCLRRRRFVRLVIAICFIADGYCLVHECRPEETCRCRCYWGHYVQSVSFAVWVEWMCLCGLVPYIIIMYTCFIAPNAAEPHSHTMTNYPFFCADVVRNECATLCMILCVSMYGFTSSYNDHHHCRSHSTISICLTFSSQFTQVHAPELSLANARVGLVFAISTFWICDCSCSLFSEGYCGSMTIPNSNSAIFNNEYFVQILITIFLRYKCYW